MFQDVWDPERFVDLIEAEGITMSCGATPFLTDLLRVPGVEDRDLSSFRIFIRITARVKDIIIRGGENVLVKEIEDVLVRHPKVRTVALVGVPDERLGEIGCACIVAEGDEAPTMQELQQFLDGEKVTRQFWPERIEVVDEMPTTPSGKIQKFKLRSQLHQQRDVRSPHRRGDQRMQADELTEVRRRVNDAPTWIPTDRADRLRPFAGRTIGSHR